MQTQVECAAQSPGFWSDVMASENAFPEGRARRLNCADGSVIVNGVRLPAVVVRALEALGMPLEAYSPGELEDAIVAFEDDGTLVEDDEGQTFEDRLHLSDAEKLERMERREARNHRNVLLYHHLYSDISNPTPQQLENPWFDNGQLDQSEREDSDRFQIVNFGHEGLFDFPHKPQMFDIVAPHMPANVLPD